MNVIHTMNNIAQQVSNTSTSDCNAPSGAGTSATIRHSANLSMHQHPIPANYFRVGRAIELLTIHSASQNEVLDAEVADYALQVINLLRQVRTIEPPKVLPEDGQAVTFTWDKDGISRYLTVSDEGIDVTHFHKASNARSWRMYGKVPLTSPHDFYKALGVIVSNQTE